MLLELGDDPVERLEHRLEVVRRTHDVLQATVELRPEPLQAFRVGDLLHLAVHHGFLRPRITRRPHGHHLPRRIPDHVQDGVDHPRDRKLLAVQELPDRIDDEGSLADVGPHDGGAGAPALVVGCGVADFHSDRGTTRSHEESEGAEGHRGELGFRPAPKQIVRRSCEESPGEADREVGFLRGDQRLEAKANRTDRLGGVAEPCPWCRSCVWAAQGSFSERGLGPRTTLSENGSVGNPVIIRAAHFRIPRPPRFT